MSDAQPDLAPTADHQHSVQHFLDRLGQALTAGRGDVVAKMWEVPALVVDDRGVIAVATEAEVASFFGSAAGQYHALGIVDTRAHILREDWITARIVNVDVRWPWLDAAGHELGWEISTYTLRVDDAGRLRLRVAILHGERALH